MSQTELAGEKFGQNFLVHPKFSPGVVEFTFVSESKTVVLNLPNLLNGLTHD